MWFSCVRSYNFYAWADRNVVGWTYQYRDGACFLIPVATPLAFLLTALLFAYIAAELFGSDCVITRTEGIRSNFSKDLRQNTDSMESVRSERHGWLYKGVQQTFIYCNNIIFDSVYCQIWFICTTYLKLLLEIVCHQKFTGTSFVTS